MEVKSSEFGNTALGEYCFNDIIGRQVRTKKDRYKGLGWEVYDLGDGKYTLAHGGNQEGVNTQVAFLPQTRKGIIIFTNNQNGYKLYTKIFDQYL